MPILVEVKRVNGLKTTLKVKPSQLELTAQYAELMGVPLIYAIYWDKFDLWTLNTPDTFAPSASSCRLPAMRALEYDCSLIMGDITFFIKPPLRRVQVFDQRSGDEHSMMHSDFGALISDTIDFQGHDFLLSNEESAALDALSALVEVSVTKQDHLTATVEELNSPYAVRVSAWMTRILSFHRVEASENMANMAAHYVFDFARRFDLPQWHLFPGKATEQITSLQGRRFEGTEFAHLDSRKSRNPNPAS